jgi:hypothetical protein
MEARKSPRNIRDSRIGTYGSAALTLGFRACELLSAAPPWVIDFLDDALVIEYNRSPLLKTLRIAVEESYSLQGEEL